MKSLIPVLVLAPALVPLAAQQTEAGIQGSLVFPQSNLRSAVDGQMGMQIGVHGAVDLGDGSELRPRIDYTRLNSGSFGLFSTSNNTVVEGIGVGADYLRYLEGRRRGLYGVAGVALTWWNTKYPSGPSDRETSPSLMIGAGHRFNSNVAMEFSFDFGHFRPAVGQASSIKAGVFYRF